MVRGLSNVCRNSSSNSPRCLPSPSRGSRTDACAGQSRVVTRAFTILLKMSGRVSSAQSRGGGKRVHKEARARGATARRSKGAWARRQGGKDCACFEAPRHECIAPEELYTGHKSVGEHCTPFLPPSVFAAASEMEHESEAACPNTLECEQDKRASVP